VVAKERPRDGYTDGFSPTTAWRVVVGGRSNDGQLQQAGQGRERSVAPPSLPQVDGCLQTGTGPSRWRFPLYISQVVTEKGREAVPTI